MGTHHDRNFRRILTCSDCDGLGRIEAGRRGPNDPDTRMMTCPECDGLGEVCVEPVEDDDLEVVPASDGAAS